MTTVEALKELFLALGGDADDVETITTNPEMVHALAGIASGAIELPKVTQADAGDVLAVDESGKWAKAEIPSQLPAVTSGDEGDALMVNSSGEWAKSAIPSQLPAVSSTDNGNVLTVVEGAWAKAAASGDGLSIIELPLNDTSIQSTGIATLPNELTCGDILTMINNGIIPAFKSVGSNAKGLIYYYVGYDAGSPSGTPSGVFLNMNWEWDSDNNVSTLRLGFIVLGSTSSRNVNFNNNNKIKGSS